MPVPPMPPVIAKSVTGQETAHEFGDAGGATKKQKMDMVIHQSPGNNLGLSFLGYPRGPGNKILPVLVILKYR